MTAIAVRDRDTTFLAGHVVDQKGAGQQEAVSQLLKDLRKMGHHDKIVIRTDREASVIDLFKRVATDRGFSKTILETPPRSAAGDRDPLEPPSLAPPALPDARGSASPSRFRPAASAAAPPRCGAGGPARLPQPVDESALCVPVWQVDAAAAWLKHAQELAVLKLAPGLSVHERLQARAGALHVRRTGTRILKGLKDRVPAGLVVPGSDEEGLAQGTLAGAGPTEARRVRRRQRKERKSGRSKR